MSTKGNLSRSFKRRTTPRFVGSGRSKGRSQGATASLSGKTQLRAKYAGKPVMITLKDLAKAYPNQSVPMMLLENVRSRALRSHRALLIDVAQSPIFGDVESSTDTQEQLLAGDDMLDLEQVITIANAAGRSSIHAMEASNRLFGVLPPGRMRGKRYPAWQFASGISGDPLRRILSKLGAVDAWGKYQFFSSAYPELGHLSPIDVLTGDVTQAGTVTDEAKALLDSPHDKRVRLVEELAEGFAHSP